MDNFVQRTADLLLTRAREAGGLRAFVGLDGFIDVIAHVVDIRESADRYTRLETIAQFAQRLALAAGQSTNVEIIPQQTKLGGNGPILANALASFGLRVTYLGALGYPALHPVFEEFARRADVHTIAEAGTTTALEFTDGKIMISSTTCLNEVTWETIAQRYGTDRLLQQMRECELVSFVNWTMLPYLDEVWRRLQGQLAPSRSKRLLFVDLADPEKRTAEDVRHALQLLAQFENQFEVALGLNEKEAWEVARTLDLPGEGDLMRLASALRQRINVSQLVIHPVTYALVATAQEVVRQEGPRIERPVLTTGGGDHFNAGYCLGRLLKLQSRQCLLLGVATSGYYVGRGLTPSLQDLGEFLRAWT